VHLQQRWKDLFDTEFDLMLYDLTSTYVEGSGTEPQSQIRLQPRQAGGLQARSNRADRDAGRGAGGNDCC
jgi:hypothetical protein